MKKDHECESTDKRLGRPYSVQECANLCVRTNGCQFFSRATNGGQACNWEHTADGSCPEGWKQSHFDFYKVKGKSYNAYQSILYVTFNLYGHIIITNNEH